MSGRPAPEPALVAARDQWEAAGRDLQDALQAYMDKLDRQIAWHAKWDKWISRAIWPGALILYVIGWALWMVVT